MLWTIFENRAETREWMNTMIDFIIPSTDKKVSARRYEVMMTSSSEYVFAYFSRIFAGSCFENLVEWVVRHLQYWVSINGRVKDSHESQITSQITKRRKVQYNVTSQHFLIRYQLFILFAGIRALSIHDFHRTWIITTHVLEVTMYFSKYFLHISKLTDNLIFTIYIFLSLSFYIYPVLLYRTRFREFPARMPVKWRDYQQSFTHCSSFKERG